MPDVTIIRVAANDSIEAGFSAAKSPKEAPIVKIRRVSRIADPTWLMFGLEQARDIIAGLQQAADDRRFERDVPWYGEGHVLHMRRLVPVSGPGFVAVDVFRKSPTSGKAEKVSRPGTSVEIPLALLSKVAGALQVAHDRCRPRGSGFLS